MKRGIPFIFAILLISNAAFAQEIIRPGIMPGNPLYGLDKALENLQLGLSGQGIPRAQVYMIFAEERLSEAKSLVDQGRTARLNEMVDDYEDNVAKANLEIGKAAGIGIDVKQIEKQIEIATDKHVVVLELVLSKSPDQAKPGIQRALDNAKEHSAQLKEKNKKAGLFTDITGGDFAWTPEELQKRAEELRKREEEINKKEEQQKGGGLPIITGLTFAENQQLSLLKQRMGIIFLITILGTFLYFHYINHRRHKELVKKYRK